jgi:hypothetical protein
MFITVTQEEVPQVRKVAAIVLNDMIKLIPRVPEADMLTVFNRFQKDEQDSVRMQGIDSCVTFSKHLPQAVSTTVALSNRVYAKIESERILVALHQEVRRRQELEDPIFSCRQNHGFVSRNWPRASKGAPTSILLLVFARQRI